MTKRMLLLVILGLAFGYSGQTFAQEHVDASTDAEEMTADSEAALAEAKAQKLRAAKEKAENARTLREANKARATAEAKRQEAGNELKKTEAEIKALLAEQARIRKEIQRSERETQASEKAIVDGRAKVEKFKGETATLNQLRTEKEAKAAATAKSRDEILAQTKAIESQKMQAQLALNKAKEEEQLEITRLEKTKVEEGLNKIRLEKEIADLRERYKVSHAHTTEMEAMVTKQRQATARLENTVKTGESEVKEAEMKEEDTKASLTPQQIQEINLKKPVQVAKPAQLTAPAQVEAPVQQAQAEKPVVEAVQPAPAAPANRAVNTIGAAARPVAAQPAAPNATLAAGSITAAAPAGTASDADMVLKRDCKIHDSPDRNSPVLGVKLGGQAVTQAKDQQQGWVVFPFTGETKGFVAKSCF